MIEITTSQMQEVILKALPEDQPRYFEGSPGIGKSVIARNTRPECFRDVPDDEYFFYDIRLSYYDPVDLHGLPVVNRETGKVDFMPIGTLPTEGYGVILWDELPNAPRATQSAALQLLLDKRIGKTVLSPNFVHLAAGNKMTDRAGTNPIISSLGDRMTRYSLVPSVDDWSLWAIEADIRTEVVAFIRFKRDMLHNFDVNEIVSPSPRSWEFVSNDLGKDYSPEVFHATIAGTVGEGAASEFLGFLRVWESLPSIDSIFLNPKKADVPTDPATLYALSGSMSQVINPDNIGAAVMYLDRLDAEFSVFTIRGALQTARAKGWEGKLRKEKAFVEWTIKNQDIVLGN